MNNPYKIFGRPETTGDLVYSYHHRANVEVLAVGERKKDGIRFPEKVFTTCGLTAPANGDYFTAFKSDERTIRQGSYQDYFVNQ